MNCVICDSPLQKPQVKFCSANCKQKEFYRRVKESNPNSTYSQLKGYLKRKLEAVNTLGGCCSKCGYNKNLSALQFHHINSNDKLFNLDARAFANRSKELILAELKKCVVLCGNCHAEEHYPENNITNVESFVKQFDRVKTLSEVDRKLKCSKCGGFRVGRRTTLCRVCSTLKSRLYERPLIEDLIFDVMEFKNSSKVSQKYKCSHKTIEKWFDYYKIDYKLLKQIVK